MRARWVVDFAGSLLHTVFIHCGLHKTGTTSIQIALAERRAILKQRGMLFPQSLNQYAGHHNLAWQISGDQRFNPSLLTIAKALDEIAAFEGDAVLSSEDFETVLHRPHALDPLVGGLHALGRTVRLVIYWRNPAAYAESLYAQILRRGYAETFQSFWEEAQSSGQVRYGDRLFQFDADRIRAALANWRAAALEERDYDACEKGKSIVADFFAVIGLPELAHGALAAYRHNKRLGLAAQVSLFVGNRVNRKLTRQESELIARLVQQGDAHPQPLPGRIFSARTHQAVVRLGAHPDCVEEDLLRAWWQGSADRS